MSTQKNYFDRYARGQSSQPSSGNSYNPNSGLNLPQTTSVISGQTSNNTLNFNNQNNFSGSSSFGQTNAYQVEGRKEQREADKSGYLKWASDLTNNIVVSGSNDYTRLSNLREAILELKSQYFNPNSGLSVKGPEGDELNRRFLLIEHEVEGLLRRRIDISTHDVVTGNRDLDFSTVLSEKQNTIIQLEKENQNLRERLRLSNVARAELQAKIEKLTRETFELKGLKGGALDDAVKRERAYAQAQQDLATLRQSFASAAGIWLNQLQTYKSKFPSNNWELDFQVTRLIQQANIQPIQVNGYTIVESSSGKTRKWQRQVDINEDLNLLVRKSFIQILQNYPNIQTSIDPRIVTFLSNATTVSTVQGSSVYQSNVEATVDVLDEVSLNRLIQIIKYVPETVRVQNVYSYSSSRSKKVEFHLRVLIKALLEQIQKLKTKYGAVLEIDEGVIGLINQEILDIVNIDDILKIFRVKERIVEVQRIVEKVVQRIVEVPQIVPIEKYVEKIVQVPKYIEVEKIIHKPVEIIKVVDNIIQKFIEVPTIEQKIVQVPTERQVLVTVEKQVPKVIEVQKIVKEVVIDTKYVQIEKPVNHIITETQTLQVIKEVPIISETVREVLKPVEFIVEKIVPVEVVRVEVVQVEKIVEKIIKEIVYVPVNSSQLVIRQKLVEVPVYIQKLVPVQTIVNKIVNVPQRIQVPVIVKEYVPEIRTVQIFVEKIVQKIVPREIQKIKNVVVEKIVEKIKIVEKKIQVPVLQDRIVTVPIEVPKIVIERVHVPHIVPVKCIEEKIIEKPKIVEVEKPYIQYIKEVQVVNCIVEKIVEVPRIIERIKEVKVRVQKIVNKLVEVPKVVEIEKVVEKIVVVPRVIQKIVQVPQIIQVVVEKIVQVPTVKVAEKIVEKIVYVDKPVQVQKIRNVYLEVDRPVEKIKEIPVVAQTVIQKKEVIQVPVEKLVTVNKQVPVQLLVDNIIEKVVESVKLIEVEKQELVIVEVPKIVDRFIEKPVEIRNTVIQHKEIHIPVQVPVREEITKTKIVEIEKVVEKAVAIIEPKVYTETKVVVNEKFTPVPQETKVPVLLPAEKQYVEPIVVDRFIEKPVQLYVEIRQQKAINVENNIPVEVYRVVELNNDRVVIGTENKIVREYVDKIVTVPTYEQYAVQKDVIVEKVVAARTTETKISPQVQIVQKVVEKENFTTVQDKVPYYEQRVQVVDRFESTQVPAFTTQEKIVTVPEFQEKIYERIIIMPQIVQVVKYITEICESQTSLLAGVHVSVLQQEARYKELYGISRKQLEILLVELRKLRGSQPHLAGLIELVQKYLIDFDRLASVQKIVAVEKEKLVSTEVPKAVLVPQQDSESIRNQLAYSLLLEKLIVELKRIKKENNNVKLQLDNDVSLFFFNELNDYTTNSNAAGNFQESLSSYTKEALGKLNSLGGNWAQSHELMLSTILAERFAMANLVKQANIEIERVQAISNANANAIKNLENKWLPAQKLISEKRDLLNRLLTNNPSLRGYPELATIAKDFDSIVSGELVSFEPLKVIESIFTVGTGTNWSRAVSRINELELSNKSLTQKLLEAEKRALTKSSVDTTSQYSLAALKSENERLVSQIDSLKKSASLNTSSNQLNQDYELRLRTSNTRIQELELQLKTANSRIADLQAQLRSSTTRVQTLESELKEAKDVKSSAASEANQLGNSSYSSSSSNVNLARTTYEVPSYASSSVYSAEPSSLSELAGLTSSGVRQASNINYAQTSGNTYGTAGTSAYQAASKLSNSGFQSGSQSTNTYTYGTANLTKTTTSNISSTGSSVTATFGTAGTTYGTSGNTGTTYGVTGNTGTTYGVTGNTGTSYGTSGNAGTTYGTSSGTAGTTYGTSGATFGSSPLTTDYGATRFNITSATSGPSYGATGISSQYGTTNLGSSSTSSSGVSGGVTGGVSGSFSGNVASSLSGSGLRQSGVSGTSGTSGTGFSSTYTFQTKKF